MVMINKTKNSQGPSCACGKTDLYEEWVKMHEQKKQDDPEPSSSNLAGEEQIGKESGKKIRKNMHAQ
jgi:hypothetical protein